MSNFIVECKCESVASLIYSVFSHLSSVICFFVCLYLIQDIRKEELVLCRGTKKKKGTHKQTC